MSEQEVWSVIKYKPKNGCEEEFINELKRLENIMKENKSYSFLNTFIRLETGELVQIAKMPNLDALLDGQVAGLEWLDSVCLLYTSPSPRDKTVSRMPSSA